MLFWLSVFTAVFVLLTPSLWQMAGKKNFKAILIWQIGKVFFAIILAYFIGYLSILDHNLSAVFSAVPFWYAIVFAVDLVITNMNNDQRKRGGIAGKKTSNTSVGLIIGSTLTGIGAITFLVWLFMAIIYPFTIKQDLYNLVQVEEKTEKIETTDIEHIPSVPIVSAHYKAEKLIGSLENSSYYQLGELTRQKIDGEEYWVAPIEYGGYFKSNKAGSIPGYIKVSAENKDDVGTLVDKYNGEPIQMKYVPSAYFGHDLDRRVRSEFPNDILIGRGFEPDDKGKPYYIMAYGHYTKYRSGTVIDGAIVVDPQSGEMKKYAIKDVPEFIDFVVPPNMASSYNEWVSKYKHGIWNAWFGSQDISDVTMWNTGEEVVGVFGPDNRMYWFTDHSSPNTNSLKGYTLMDGRTGKFVYYTGSKGFANARAAVDAVQNSFKKEQWSGTSPILYNIYGADTWYVPVVDSNGLLRSIALVNAQNPQVVAYGETKHEALSGYKFKLTTEGKGDNAIPTNASNSKEIEGKVLRVSSIQFGESMVIQVLLENDAKVYAINPKESAYASFIQVGDQVKLSYVDTNESMVSVDKVFNVTLNR